MSKNDGMDIAEFLEARIAEDEAIAKAAAASDPSDNSFHIDSGPAGEVWADNGGILTGATTHLWDCEGSSTLCTSNEVSAHMARHDPARVLAECAAKRSIISGYDDALDTYAGSRAMDHVLEALAAVHKDHPDYQQEWKV